MGEGRVWGGVSLCDFQVGMGSGSRVKRKWVKEEFPEFGIWVIKLELGDAL